MIARVYTIEEINRMLPLVRAIVDDVVDCARILRDATGLEHLRRGVPGPEQLPVGSQQTYYDLRRCRRELEALGGYLRDPEAGVVEWYGELDGDIVYLSWARGEASVSHWRGLYSRPSARKHMGVMS